MRRARRKWGRHATPLTLAEPWRRWIAENLMNGADSEEILAHLAGEGVPRVLAEEAVIATLASPAFAAGRVHARRADRLALVLRLRDHFATPSTEVEQRDHIEPAELYERYFATGTPVVMTGFMKSWPARTRWGLADLEARFGAEQVQICSGRAADPDPDMRYEDHLETTTVADFAHRLRDPGPKNDLYLIANNQALEKTALRALLDDIEVPPFMHPQVDPGCASLWIGPAGTLTPLHHDTCHILFCQVVGRKRFRLFAPGETRLLEAPRGFYAADPLRDEPALEVTLEPGHALFLPAGWWHEVHALDFSMSISLLRFQRPSTVTWYTPGQV
jgi:hypothetical protein